MSKKEELEKEKKLKKLQEAAKTAKWGIKDSSATEKVKDTVGKVVRRVAKDGITEIKNARTGFSNNNTLRKNETVAKEAGMKAANSIGRTTSERDARQEKEVGNKYKNVSPIMSKGVFSSATPKDGWKNTGITQEEVDKKRKNK